MPSTHSIQLFICSAINFSLAPSVSLAPVFDPLQSKAAVMEGLEVRLNQVTQFITK